MDEQVMKEKLINDFEKELEVVKDGDGVVLMLPLFDFFGTSIMIKARKITKQVELSDMGHAIDTLWLHSVTLSKKSAKELEKVFSITFENGNLIKRVEEDNMFYAIMDMVEAITRIQKRVINIVNPVKELEQEFVSIVRKDLDKQGLVSHTNVKVHAIKTDVKHPFWLKSHNLLVDPITAWSTRSANSRLKAEFIKVYDVFSNGSPYSGIILLDDREIDTVKKRRWDQRMIRRIQEYIPVFYWKKEHENYTRYLEEIAPKYGQFLIPE